VTLKAFYVVFAFFGAVIVLFAVLNWRSAKTYRPTPQHVVHVLDAVLAGTVTYMEWDTFICVPIRHDPRLEAIRLKCTILDQDASLFAGMGNKWQGDAGFNETGLNRIRGIRDELVAQIPGAVRVVA
jgi:hypothetical protein